ncbi:MAG TPA: SWIM zinc finger family protein [Bryobacteraceae bacterium]|nr:SWIM zinc finger family protein [Bryobacteraceae bacterium]
MLRRSKDQVLALPPKLRQWLPVEVRPGIGAAEMARVVGLLLANMRGEGSAARQSKDRLRLLAPLIRARPGVSYLLECDAAGDVTCSCPGFQYRGQCSHARELKARLVQGGPLPAEYCPD